MDFLSDINPIQWMLIAIGVFILGGPVVTNGRELIARFWKEREKDNTPVDRDLTDLVCKWECLSDATHKAGLYEACEKLDEVFPLLIGVKHHDHDDLSDDDSEPEKSNE
tara:strand:+ start:3601 stop:3927 length:327 start_codon:yes stop_codon:yes gene_type:complete